MGFIKIGFQREDIDHQKLLLVEDKLDPILPPTGEGDLLEKGIVEADLFSPRRFGIWRSRCSRNCLDGVRRSRTTQDPATERRR
jgi:hypothetical protein